MHLKNVGCVEVVRNGVLLKFDIELVNAPGGFREISRLQPVHLHSSSENLPWS